MPRWIAAFVIAVAAPAGADEYHTVVTTTRSEAPLADVAVATEIIGREEIERSGAETLGELLATSAGVAVERGFAGDEVQLQGLAGRYVLILVDGRRVIGRKDGTVDSSRLPLDDVERVEIVRGPSSSLYGSDALGGSSTS